MTIIKKANIITGQNLLIGKDNNLYRHYKGGIYKLICNAKHTENSEGMVIYSDGNGEIWARPSEMFYSMVELEDGSCVPRFDKITENLE